jgi:hypothetical protein
VATKKSRRTCIEERRRSSASSRRRPADKGDTKTRRYVAQHAFSGPRREAAAGQGAGGGRDRRRGVHISRCTMHEERRVSSRLETQGSRAVAWRRGSHGPRRGVGRARGRCRRRWGPCEGRLGSASLKTSESYSQASVHVSPHWRLYVWLQEAVAPVTVRGARSSRGVGFGAALS